MLCTKYTPHSIVQDAQSESNLRGNTEKDIEKMKKYMANAENIQGKQATRCIATLRKHVYNVQLIGDSEKPVKARLGARPRVCSPGGPTPNDSWSV